MKKMKKTIYNEIYNMLISLIPDLEKMEVGSQQISKSDGFMDLHLNIVRDEKKEQNQTKVISLAHYYKLANYYERNSESVPNPCMTIRICSYDKTAEALTFRNSLEYQEVYLNPTTFSILLEMQLNSFLKTWLDNCIQQGHKFGGSEKN